MVPRGSSRGEELPPGWREHVKVTNGRKIKFYTHPECGIKVYSKKRVWSLEQMALEGTLGEQDQKSITTKNGDEMMVCQGTLHSSSEQNQKSVTTRSQDKVQAFQGTLQSSSEEQQQMPKSEVDPVVVETNASLDWLPFGWIVESKVRKTGTSAGTAYKIYVDPSTGCKFNSKPNVIKYLENVYGKSMPEKQNEVSVDKSYKRAAPRIIPIEKKPECVKDDSEAGKSLVVSRSTRLDGLPPGWVKEVRARKGDTSKKDPYYIDPDSGYEFRSKKDVLRYLESGDMSRCAMKPQPRKHVEKAEHFIPTPTRSACQRLDLNAINHQGVVSSSASATLPETKAGCIFAAPKLESGQIDDEKLHASRPRTRTRSQLLQEEDVLEARKRKSPSMPDRSSKRLLGVEPDLLPVSSERAIRAAVKKAIQGQARVYSIMENGFPTKLCCEVASPSKEDDVQKRPEQEAMKVQEIPKQTDQKEEEKAEQKVEENPKQVEERREVESCWYPFGDSLADPCYEFACKTLTEEIPFEDTLAFAVVASSVQNVVSTGLPAIGTPALFQNDVPFQLDPVPDE